MSLDLTGLTKWTDEHAMDLLKESILKGRTTDIIQVQGGVKHSATINRLSSDLTAQAGACGWNADGTTNLDQRVIEVSDIKINEAICLNDLEDYYTSTMMNPGSYNEDVPFEQIFAENKRDQVNALVEDLVWQGDTAGGSGNLALADGFVTMFDAGITASSDRYGTYSTAVSGSDLVDLVDEIVEKVPENVINNEDLYLFMSYADYRKYAKALRDLNLFHYTGAENQGEDFSQMHPGTNVKVIAVRGLNGQNRMVLSPTSNMFVGTDLLNDAEDFKLFYSQDNDEVRFLAKFKLGVQVAWLDQVVYYVGE